MADIGWARSRGNRAEKQGLRRGAWYRVVEDEKKDYVVLDVHHVEVRMDRGDLEIRKDAPKAQCTMRATGVNTNLIVNRDLLPRAVRRRRGREGRQMPRVRPHVSHRLEGRRLELRRHVRGRLRHLQLGIRPFGAEVLE